MEVFQEINKNKNKNLVIALGYFDGIHIGHRKIINTLLKMAHENNLKSAVVTFDKNPANYFSQEQTLDIQNYKDKELILEGMGVDFLYELDFEQFKNISAQEYLKDILVKNLNPKIIIVGYNHTFGKDKSGNAEFLKSQEENYGYRTIIVPEIKYNDCELVSSTIIRQRIELGHLNAVKALLGRNFTIRNSVIQGEKYAQKFGYPTANLLWPNSLVKLPYGVYFGFAQGSSFKTTPALISWGTKPTMSDGKSEILEAHIYNLDEDLYGKIIKIGFIKKLREQEKFANIKLLKEQMDKDYEAFENWAKTIM